jgi:hypothetical protein
MQKFSNFGRAAALVIAVVSTAGFAADAPKRVAPPAIGGTTWTITPMGNGNLTPKTVVYGPGKTSGTATIYDSGSAKPAAPNATWSLNLAGSYVMMFAEGNTRGYRSAWAMNGQPQNPMLGFSCTLKAPSVAPKFNCTDNGSNYTQARR